MAIVIDTNVFLVAAGCAAQADPPCVDACIEAIDGILADDAPKLAVDSENAILGEYRDNLPAQSASCRKLNQLIQRGRVEYRWCERDAEGRFVVPGTLLGLDASDRKFAAVALTYDPPAPVYNAVDNDWRQCEQGLRGAGIAVSELCPQCLR